MKSLLFLFLFLSLATFSVVAQVAPNAQILGSGWVGRHISAQGTVIAENGACRQIAVDRGDGLQGVAGRLWGCWSNPDRAPEMGNLAHIRGQVSITRMTRIGPFMRVVPQINGL